MERSQGKGETDIVLVQVIGDTRFPSLPLRAKRGNLALHRHCERSVAISFLSLDCFVAKLLAMRQRIARARSKLKVKIIPCFEVSTEKLVKLAEILRRLTTKCHGYIVGDKSNECQDASLRVEMGNVGSYTYNSR